MKNWYKTTFYLQQNTIWSFFDFHEIGGWIMTCQNQWGPCNILHFVHSLEYFCKVFRWVATTFFKVIFISAITRWPPAKLNSNSTGTITNIEIGKMVIVIAILLAYYIIGYHLILNHIILYHINIILYHIISYYIILYYITSLYIYLGES